MIDKIINIQVFVWLIFMHALGDLGLQTPYIVEHKKDKFNVMICHCILWAGCIGIALKYMHNYASWKMLFLIIAHYFTDTWSVNKINKENWNRINTIDQAWHFLQLNVVYWF